MDTTKEVKPNELKVSSKSNPSSVAGAIVALLRDHSNIEVEVIGAGALNQAVKAVAIGRGFLAPAGQDLILAPSFQDVEIDGESRTGLRLYIEKRARL